MSKSLFCNGCIVYQPLELYHNLFIKFPVNGFRLFSVYCCYKQYYTTVTVRWIPGRKIAKSKAFNILIVISRLPPKRKNTNLHPHYQNIKLSIYATPLFFWLFILALCLPPPPVSQLFHTIPWLPQFFHSFWNLKATVSFSLLIILPHFV